MRYTIPKIRMQKKKKKRVLFPTHDYVSLRILAASVRVNHFFSKIVRSTLEYLTEAVPLSVV